MVRLDQLQNASALPNPIQWDEPFALVMIEELSCGTPVIACPRGAAPEIVDAGVTGFLAESVNDIASLIASASTLDRAKCRRAAEDRFNTERVVQDHLAFYRRVPRNLRLAPRHDMLCPTA